MTSDPSELDVEVAQPSAEVLRLLIDLDHLGVARAFLQLVDPVVDGLFLAFDRGDDGAVAVVLDETFQAEAAGHARGEESVADALHLAVDVDVPQLFRHFSDGLYMRSATPRSSPRSMAMRGLRVRAFLRRRCRGGDRHRSGRRGGR